MCSLTVTGLLQTDRVLTSTHVTGLVRDRSEQLGAVVDPLRDSDEVSIIKLALLTPVCLTTEFLAAITMGWIGFGARRRHWPQLMCKNIHQCLSFIQLSDLQKNVDSKLGALHWASDELVTELLRSASTALIYTYTSVMHNYKSTTNI